MSHAIRETTSYVATSLRLSQELREAQASMAGTKSVPQHKLRNARDARDANRVLCLGFSGGTSGSVALRFHSVSIMAHGFSINLEHHSLSVVFVIETFKLGKNKV